MEEKKKEDEKTLEKAFWIIGIALIVFLIILGGVLIGLKITRDGANRISGSLDGKNGGAGENYVVQDDGSRVVTNKDVTNYSAVVAGRKFSNFVIEEKDGFSSLAATIANVAGEKLESKQYMITLYDEEDNEIQGLPIIAGESEANSAPSKIQFGTIINDLSGVARIEVNEVEG